MSTCHTQFSNPAFTRRWGLFGEGAACTQAVPSTASRVLSVVNANSQGAMEPAGYHWNAITAASRWWDAGPFWTTCSHLSLLWTDTRADGSSGGVLWELLQCSVDCHIPGHVQCCLCFCDGDATELIVTFHHWLSFWLFSRSLLAASS